MRVLMFGMFDRTYPRNRSVVAALAEGGASVPLAHRRVWEKLRVHESPWSGWIKRGYLALRVLWAMISLIPEGIWKARKADVIWVGFPGHTDVALAALIGKLTGTPVVFDAFISWYDSAVRDRGLFGKKSFTARLLRWFDYVSCKLSDRVVVDTPEHAVFFTKLLKVRPAKMMVLPVGVDESVFRHPSAAQARTPSTSNSERPLRVLQYAEYTPLHGGRYVLDALAELNGRGVPVEMELIGDSGPWFTALREQAAELQLPNLTLSGYVPERELVGKVLDADVVLGIFGDTPKARRVVPNKVVQGLAMGRCVLTGDSEAIRTALLPEIEIKTCSMADAESMADALAYLAEHPEKREAIAEAGHRRFEAEMSGSAIAAQLNDSLKSLLSKRARLASRRADKRLAKAS